MDTSETDNRQSGKGKSPDNVVRLPRDWLGPREDLVPFGPSERSDTPARDSALPPSAHAFWGGEDPSGPIERPIGAGIPPWRRVRKPRLAQTFRPWRGGGIGIRLAGQASPRLVVGLVAIALLVTAFVVTTISRPTPRTHQPGRSYSASSFGTPASAVDHVSRGSQRARRAALARINLAARRQQTPAPHRPRAQPRRRQHETPKHRAAPKATLAVQPVRYTAPAPTYTAPPVSSSAGAGGTSSAATPTPAQATTASAGGSSSSAASSTNPPATGANGILGPGHGNGTG